MDLNTHGWNELEVQVKEFVVAAQALTECETNGPDSRVEPSTTPAPLFDTTSEKQLARRRVTAVVGRLQNLLSEPEDLIQRLAHHVSISSLVLLQQHI